MRDRVVLVILTISILANIFLFFYSVWISSENNKAILYLDRCVNKLETKIDDYNFCVEGFNKQKETIDKCRDIIEKIQK